MNQGDPTAIEADAAEHLAKLVDSGEITLDVYTEDLEKIKQLSVMTLPQLQALLTQQQLAEAVEYAAKERMQKLILEGSCSVRENQAADSYDFSCGFDYSKSRAMKIDFPVDMMSDHAKYHIDKRKEKFDAEVFQDETDLKKA